jgi:hypothetical protein
MTRFLASLLFVLVAMTAGPALAGTGGPWAWGQTGLLIIIIILLLMILKSCQKKGQP